MASAAGVGGNRTRSGRERNLTQMMRHRKLMLAAIDTLLILGIYYGAAILAIFNPQSIMISGAFTFAKWLTLYLCIMTARMLARAYNNIWRYANVTTYFKLVLADLLGGVLFILLGRIFKQTLNLGVACSTLIIFAVIIGSLCIRFLYQEFYAYRAQRSDRRALGMKGESQMHKINVAIVGAGNVGATLADELIRNPKSHYTPYCFIDRDREKVGSGINGLQVLMEDEQIIRRLRAMPVQEIIIAIPEASPEAKNRLYNLYRQTDCKVKIYDHILGDDGTSAGKRQLRELRIEDLLFRESVSINSSEDMTYYTGKTVLVTGGGGSIGSELCRQIAALGPRKLVILDIYENNAYEIQQELIRKYGSRLDLETVIASVRDVKRMEEVFRELRPDVVFHAAAHKHVPLMEENPCEAVKNNVLGTKNVADLAEKYGVQRFLLISTDKAVNPTNVMGASKRLCEMVIQCRGDGACTFTAVRFGNVLGSNGSVIPLFRKQIEAGGPITLTDKRIVRYFMTIPEAVGLVMEACAMARKGELFVLDMGKPVKILDLAENMIRLSGLTPYRDIDIVEIGLRPGEKLYEELLMQTEEQDKTKNSLIYIERDKALSRAEVEQKLSVLTRAVQTQDPEQIVAALHETVPTYRCPEEVNRKAVTV